ncbi:MAG TPA: hypothetical protein DCK95_09665, partial [Anaerolineaceae bacterium]|nr:hypothetical protein [Anaerolineaceae bacterium]
MTSWLRTRLPLPGCAAAGQPEGIIAEDIPNCMCISRPRVNIWRNQDVAFMQTLQERRRVLRAAYMAQLLHMV